MTAETKNIAKNILFVCTGNTCRSPMAEIIATDFAKKNGFLNMRFSSRGINVLVPRRATENAVRAVKMNFALDLSNHIARQVIEEDIVKADWILCMTKQHCLYLANVFPVYQDKFQALHAFVQEKGTVDDPYGNDIFKYRKIADELERCIIKLFLLIEKGELV